MKYRVEKIDDLIHVVVVLSRQRLCKLPSSGEKISIYNHWAPGDDTWARNGKKVQYNT